MIDLVVDTDLTVDMDSMIDLLANAKSTVEIMASLSVVIMPTQLLPRFLLMSMEVLKRLYNLRWYFLLAQCQSALCVFSLTWIMRSLSPLVVKVLVIAQVLLFIMSVLLRL